MQLTTAAFDVLDGSPHVIRLRRTTLWHFHAESGAVHNINRGRGRDDLTGAALSPRIAQRTRAGVGLRAGGKLAVELGEQREVRGEVELGPSCLSVWQRSTFCTQALLTG